jgi:hypothetical protein
MLAGEPGCTEPNRLILHNTYSIEEFASRHYQKFFYYSIPSDSFDPSTNLRKFREVLGVDFVLKPLESQLYVHGRVLPVYCKLRGQHECWRCCDCRWNN